MRVLAALALLLTACGGGAADTAAPGGGRTELVVDFRADDKVATTRLTLSCDPPAGEHPDPPAACADLAKEGAPFTPLAQGQACTEIYGGPQTATVRGTYRGAEVQVELARTDGCRIAQWDRLGALLPPVAAAPGEPLPS